MQLWISQFGLCTFLPRCMECKRSLAMRILSVCPSVKRVDCDKTDERSVQIVTPYERSFSLVFWEEWLVGVDPKRTTAVFRVKSHFAWRKSATKFSLCEKCQRQSCKTFIGLTIRAKMIGVDCGATPFMWNFGSNWPCWRRGRDTAVPDWESEKVATLTSWLNSYHFLYMHCNYTVSQKNIPDVFSYNSRKHWRIFTIFGRNVTEKASSHILLPLLPN